MKRSCAGYMIWRQVKQVARVKLHLFLFHLKFVKLKKFFTILALKQPNSEKRIFAVYKYLRRFLKRILSLKFLSNLLVWLFNGWLTPSQILIFSYIILHNFILLLNSNSFISKLIIFIWIRCVFNLHSNLRQYQIHNVV